EYWSLARYRGKFGRLMRPDKDMAKGEFLDHASSNFGDAARRWLTGMEPFTAKLNPAYAPHGDYDQLMRLEEWYGRKRRPSFFCFFLNFDGLRDAPQMMS